ncbi:MAG TPA: hypothetical protein VLA88_04235 [Candidatus Saccharimonadales bacterium]|nr:hypothetical protein [Candidatus Saccharimonadales bacterium]
MDAIPAVLALIWKAIVEYDETVAVMQFFVWCSLLLVGLRFIAIMTYRVRKGYKERHAAHPEILYRRMTRFFGMLALTCVYLLDVMIQQANAAPYEYELQSTYADSLLGVCIFGGLAAIFWAISRFYLFEESELDAVREAIQVRSRRSRILGWLRSKHHRARMDDGLTKILKAGAKAHGHGE